MLTHRFALALALPVLLVAGCASDEPGAEEEPTPGPTDHEIQYPEEHVGLVDRPELKGAYEQALQTYVDFERGRRLAALDGKVGRLLSFNATARVVDPYRKALASYDGDTYDGNVLVEFLDARTRDTVLLLDICVDATGLVVPDGAPPVLGEATRAPQRIQVTNIVGPWRVTRAEPADGPC